MRWKAWGALRERTHITLAFMMDLPDTTGGAVYARRGNRAVVLIDPRLDRRRRHAALAHELIHDERGIDVHELPATPLWRPLQARDERQVDDEVARRLVPLDELERVVSLAEACGHGLEAWEVADEFDVPDEVARRACELLKRRRAS